MNTRYWDKATLYKQVDMLLCNTGIVKSYSDYPLCSIYIASQKCKNLVLEELPLKNICGILDKGEKYTSIALNSNRSYEMQNFDCMHELIHYFFHDVSQYLCFESNSINQNPILEWQANEGAAQALIPYQMFIPRYVQESKYFAHDKYRLECIIENLSKFYNTSIKVIENRIQSLDYAIYQYLSGVSIKNIKILSKAKIEKLGLTSYKSHIKYCKKCLSPVNDSDIFCSICGTGLSRTFEEYTSSKIYGVGYIVYDGLHGQGLLNQCTNTNCKEILNGNSRYCHKCGSYSRFYLSYFIPEWKIEYYQKNTVPTYIAN